MIKSVLVLALFALVAVASAQSCSDLGGTVTFNAQYTNASFTVAVNETTNQVIVSDVGSECAPAVILLRQGFDYEVTHNLTNSTGDNITVTFVFDSEDITLEGEGVTTFTLSAPGHGNITVDGVLVGAVSVYGAATPVPESAALILADLYIGSSTCSGTPAPAVPQPLFCLDVAPVLVQCESNGTAVVPVSYSCNACPGSPNSICDKMPPAQWPEEGACQASGVNSVEFSCVPFPPTDVPTNAPTDAPTDVPSPSAAPTEEPSANPTDEPETATALPPPSTDGPAPSTASEPTTAVPPTSSSTSVPPSPPAPSSGAEMVAASLAVVAAAVALAF